MSRARLASPSPLNPAGSEAHHLAAVWWLLLVLATAVAIVVIGFVVVALFRTDRDRSGPGEPSPDAGTPRERRFIIGGGIVFPVVVLSVVAVTTVGTTEALRKPVATEERIDVEGERWFWNVSYPVEGIKTANEIHLEVGKPVAISLRSDNVIHSFWVPQLAGKLDVVPGQTNVLRFTPTKIGTYRGECAEFCGIQHANMNFVVDVVSSSTFSSWVATHRVAPAAPTGSLAAQGRADFARLACAGCHTISGVSTGTVGPDLTDIGERATLGAGTLTNDATHLSEWINDAPHYKPGIIMPPIQLTANEITALVAYLQSLK